MPVLHDSACVVHLHSTYSDGTGTVPEIAAAARANALDVVLLTDHDTMAARDHGEEGWHGSVLVLVGEEVSPPGRNHYLAFGLDRPVDHEGLSPAQILDAVAAGGGFGFAAHPFSHGNPNFGRVGKAMPWGDLDAPALAGIELWSFVTDTAETLGGWRDVARFVARPQVRVDHPPERNMAEYDRLCASRRVVALGGLDAHQIGLRIGGRVPLRLMSYRRSFRFLRTHVLTREPLAGVLAPDRAEVLGALREGRCYIAMDAVAPARGFAFWGDDGIDMGAQGPASALHVRLPRPARLRLVRDGAVIADLPGAAALDHAVEDGGVYRVEARLPAYGRERTWILSNPIYMR
ncbi:MAG: hypothetical protein QOJ07_805 [Thermoleophilaceae bacterium]|nr:hypothetical protein [Thermoleophilaceae bacterium]